MSTWSVFRKESVSARSFFRSSPVCAPVLVAMKNEERSSSPKARPIFFSLSVYLRDVSKKLIPPASALRSIFTASSSDILWMGSAPNPFLFTLIPVLPSVTDCPSAMFPPSFPFKNTIGKVFVQKKFAYPLEWLYNVCIENLF